LLVKRVLRKLLGLYASVVVCGFELAEAEGARSKLAVTLGRQSRTRGRCGRCRVVAPWFDNGGGVSTWCHVDVGFAASEVVPDAASVKCPVHGPTVIELSWVRRDSRFSRAFENVVVYEPPARTRRPWPIANPSAGGGEKPQRTRRHRGARKSRPALWSGHDGNRGGEAQEETEVPDRRARLPSLARSPGLPGEEQGNPRVLLRGPRRTTVSTAPLRHL